MKFNLHKFLSTLVVAGVAATVISCNKDVEDPMPITSTPPTGSSIASIVNTNPNYTFLRAAITKASSVTSNFGASLATLLADSTASFTVFAPTDAAFQLSGFPSAAAVSAQRAGFLDTVLRYHIIGGQRLTSALIPTTFPNVQEPTLLTIQPPSTSLPPGLRMPIFPSKRGNLLWANNVPLTAADIIASNGVIHAAATIIAPPSTVLWTRINTDASLTFLKAAIQRADSGLVTSASPSLEYALGFGAANLTVFAPSNAAVQATLTPLITQALVAQGLPLATAQAQAAALTSSPTVFSNPALYGALSAQTVRGLVVYHVLGSRAFTNNIPTAATAVPTLLNSAVPIHPGIMVQATFSGTNPYVVSAATVKGLGNATASNIVINPTPAPNGTSDQHYVNGTLHIIDQLLLPQ